jgi:hypothetical protein
MGFVDNNYSLRRERMSLKVLDLKDAERHLEEYVELTRELIKFDHNLDKAKGLKRSKLIVVGSVKFDDSLAKEVALK